MSMIFSVSQTQSLLLYVPKLCTLVKLNRGYTTMKSSLRSDEVQSVHENLKGKSYELVSQAL